MQLLHCVHQLILLGTTAPPNQTEVLTTMEFNMERFKTHYMRLDEMATELLKDLDRLLFYNDQHILHMKYHQIDPFVDVHKYNPMLNTD